MKRIVFAGGCFWGVEQYFIRLKGVIKTSVGYVNGNISNPSYEQVCKNEATHAEAVEIYYEGITLDYLLDQLFRIIDPTSLNKQGNDIGIQYRTGVYYKNIDDKEIIDEYIKNVSKNYESSIVVEVKEETEYYLAEDYHQKYLEKNINGYCHIDLSKASTKELK